MKIEELKDRWHKNYEVDPNGDLDVELRIGLTEENGQVLAYVGTADGYEDRKAVKDTRDIVEFFKQYLENDF